jgi:hypothetical protein
MPALMTNAGTLEEVVIAFVWPRAGGAWVIILALAVVEDFAGGKEEHAEFEDKFALLEAPLVCCGNALPIYRVGDCSVSLYLLKPFHVQNGTIQNLALLPQLLLILSKHM